MSICIALGYRAFVSKGSERPGERYLDSQSWVGKKENTKAFQRPCGRKRAEVASKGKVWEEVEKLLRGWQMKVVRWGLLN